MTQGETGLHCSTERPAASSVNGSGMDIRTQQETEKRTTLVWAGRTWFRFQWKEKNVWVKL